MESLKNLKPLIRRYVETTDDDTEYTIDRLMEVTKHFACKFVAHLEVKGVVDFYGGDIEELFEEFQKTKTCK